MKKIYQGEVSHRHNTAADWILKKLRPYQSELIHETDTNKFKLGDGIHNAEDPLLPYFIDEPTINARISAASGGLTFVWDQNTPSASWIVAHNFGRFPVVALYIGGELVDADVTADDAVVSVSFPDPVSGKLVIT